MPWDPERGWECAVALQERELSWHSETVQRQTSTEKARRRQTTFQDWLALCSQALILPDFPIRTPSKAGLHGHQPQRGGGNDVRGSRAASCGHRGVVHSTASIMSESRGPQFVSSCSLSTQPPSPGRLGKQNKSHPKGPRVWSGVGARGKSC